VVFDFYLHVTDKTANLNHRNIAVLRIKLLFINNNKTANIKDKNLKVYNDV